MSEICAKCQTEVTPAKVPDKEGNLAGYVCPECDSWFNAAKTEDSD